MTLKSNVLQVYEPTSSRIMDNPKLITLSATELFWGQNIWKGLTVNRETPLSVPYWFETTVSLYKRIDLVLGEMC